jgi:hypothetical protein
MTESKEILTLEFRYFDKWEKGTPYKTKTTCLGIFDNFEDATSLGNKILEEIFYKQFNISNRLSTENRSISDSVVIPRGDFLKCHFAFYLRIEKLEFRDTQDILEEVLKTFNTL